MREISPISEPKFIKTFLNFILKVSAVFVAVILSVLLFVNFIFPAEDLTVKEQKLDDLERYVIQRLAYTGRLNPVLYQLCEIRGEILDLYEEYGVDVCVRYEDEILTDTAETVVLEMPLGSNSNYMYMDDYDYPEFMSSYSDLLEYSGQSSSKHIYVSDAYIDWSTRTFYPGFVNLIYNDRIVKVIDLTPDKELSGFQHIYDHSYTYNHIPMRIRGVHRVKTTYDRFDNKKVHVNAYDTTDIEFMIHIVTYRDKLISQIIIHKFFFFSVLILSDLILSLILAVSKYYREKSIYEIFEYRRKTTDAMAHDLKTPLAISYLYYEKLHKNPDGDRRGEYYGELGDSLKYMDSLITNILNFSKSQYSNVKLKKENIDVRELTQKLIDEIKPKADEKNLTFEIEGDYKVETDRKLLTQAIYNLLTNALKYSLPDSVVTVGLNNGITVTNRIEETIPNPEKLKEPFVKGLSVRGENTGSGLGLAVVDSNTHKLGFKLTLESSENTFSAKISKPVVDKKHTGLIVAAAVLALILIAVPIIRNIKPKPPVTVIPGAKYEFKFDRRSKYTFDGKLANIPVELQRYLDIGIIGNITVADGIDARAMTYYPVQSLVREFGSGETIVLKNYNSSDFYITDSFASQLEGHYVESSNRINVNRINVNGRHFTNLGTIDSMGEEFDILFSWKTFFDEIKNYDTIIFYYSSPLSEEEEETLIQYMQERFPLTEYNRVITDVNNGIF